jgi:pimeloyl-ACP methyl ester carboxylesterase
MPETWNLRRRLTLSGGEIAYDVLGYGPPLILVHGTPSRSYIWRDVVLRLADRLWFCHLVLTPSRQLSADKERFYLLVSASAS